MEMENQIEERSNFGSFGADNTAQTSPVFSKTAPVSRKRGSGEHRELTCKKVRLGTTSKAVKAGAQTNGLPLPGQPDFAKERLKALKRRHGKPGLGALSASSSPINNKRKPATGSFAWPSDSESDWDVDSPVKNSSRTKATGHGASVSVNCVKNGAKLTLPKQSLSDRTLSKSPTKLSCDRISGSPLNSPHKSPRETQQYSTSPVFSRSHSVATQSFSRLPASTSPVASTWPLSPGDKTPVKYRSVSAVFPAPGPSKSPQAVSPVNFYRTSGVNSGDKTPVKQGSKQAIVSPQTVSPLNFYRTKSVNNRRQHAVASSKTRVIKGPSQDEFDSDEDDLLLASVSATDAPAPSNFVSAKTLYSYRNLKRPSDTTSNKQQPLSAIPSGSSPRSYLPSTRSSTGTLLTGESVFPSSSGIRPRDVRKKVSPADIKNSSSSGFSSMASSTSRSGSAASSRRRTSKKALPATASSAGADGTSVDCIALGATFSSPGSRGNPICLTQSDTPDTAHAIQCIKQLEQDEDIARKLQEDLDMEFAMSLQNQDSASGYNSPTRHSPTGPPGLMGIDPAYFGELGIDQSPFGHLTIPGFPGIHSSLLYNTPPPNESPTRGRRRRSRNNRNNQVSETASLTALEHLAVQVNRVEQELQNQMEPIINPKLKLGGRGRRGRRGARANIAADNDDYEFLLNLGETLGEVKPKGLKKTELNRLPVRAYKGGDKADECNICMCNYETDDQLKMLPCFHEFHDSCIDKWIAKNATCPVCRVDVAVS